MLKSAVSVRKGLAMLESTSTVNSIRLTTDTVEAIGKMAQQNSNAIQNSIDNLTAASANQYALPLSLLVNVGLIIVGLVQARIYFNTLKEMRISRQSIAVPFLRIEAAGNQSDSYLFRIVNDGAGPALNVSFYINEKMKPLTEVDLIPPHDRREIKINLNQAPEWLTKKQHEIYLMYKDVHSSSYIADFTVENTGRGRDKLPVGSTLKFVRSHKSES